MESLCNKVRLGNEFFITTGGRPFKRNAFEYAFQKIRDVVDVSDSGYPHARLYDFRHTFATRAIEYGMNPKILQKLLGHGTLQMTMGLYCHVTEDTLFLETEKFKRRCS